MGRPWPWIDPLENENFEEKVFGVIEPYWTKKLAKVPPEILSEEDRNKLQQVLASVRPDSRAGAGYQYAKRASRGGADAFWFFELGCPAWISILSNMRHNGWLPRGGREINFAGIEQLWAKKGPAVAAAYIDKATEKLNGHIPPALALYRVPLALWSDKDPKKAMDLLDRSLAPMGSEAIGVMGVTLPLTYALTRALSGDIKGAEKMLDEEVHEGRPRGMAGLYSPEARYWRARFLWELKEYEVANALLEKVFSEDATYILRLFTDPAWKLLSSTVKSEVRELLREVFSEASSEIMDFQHSRGSEVTDEKEEEIIDILDFSSNSPYFYVAAANLIKDYKKWKGGQVEVGFAFQQDLEEMRNAARRLPAGMPLKLGGHFKPRFRGPNSDVEHVEELVNKRLLGDAEKYLEELLPELPIACNQATAAYGARLMDSLISAAKLLYTNRNQEDRQRLKILLKLIDRCGSLAEPVRNLPDTLSKGFYEEIETIWKGFAALEDFWRQADVRAYGELRVKMIERPKPVVRGSWAAFPVIVVDSANNPVSGSPVYWRVLSGPARPKEPVEGIEGEWFVSLKTGRAYIAVTAMGPGEKGQIEVRVVGHPKILTLDYTVVDDIPEGGTQQYIERMPEEAENADLTEV